MQVEQAKATDEKTFNGLVTHMEDIGTVTSQFFVNKFKKLFSNK